MRDRLVDLAWRRGGALGVAILIVYIWLAPTWILGGDNAEFVTLGMTGGVAHPSGYPLYVLYLRAMSWLPGSTPAHSAAIATAILGAAAMVMLHAACRAWGARPGAAAIAVAVLAGSPLVLRMFTQAEAFALNCLVAATILWLSAPAGPITGRRRVVMLGLVAGLGIANHLSCVFLAPVGVFGAITGVRERGRAPAATIGLAVAALAVGLTPYLYLLVAPSGGLGWGRIDSVGALIDHVLRRDYGGMGRLAPRGGEVPALTSIAALGASLVRSWLWVGVVGGLGGLAWGIARGPRIAWLCLAASIAAAGPGLVARFNVPPTPGIELYVCERFHLLPVVLLAVPVAVGLDRLAAWVGARWRWMPRRGLVPAIAGGCLVLSIALSLPGQARVHSAAVERAYENLLKTAPERAVILVSGDHYYFAGGYMQLVRGLRPDVVLIDAAMFGFAWYRERIDRRLGFTALPPGSAKPDLRFAAAVHAAGRPLLVDYVYGLIANEYPSYPYGMMVRVLPRGEAVPPIADVVRLNKELYDRFDLTSYPAPHQADDWSADIHATYAETWRQLARALVADGDREGAAWARSVSADLAPRVDP